MSTYTISVVGYWPQADTSACLWDADTGKLLATLAHNYPVNAGAFSPNDKVIATGTGKGVRLWDARAGKLLRTLTDFEKMKIVL